MFNAQSTAKVVKYHDKVQSHFLSHYNVDYVEFLCTDYQGTDSTVRQCMKQIKRQFRLGYLGVLVHLRFPLFLLPDQIQLAKT